MPLEGGVLKRQPNSPARTAFKSTLAKSGPLKADGIVAQLKSLLPNAKHEKETSEVSLPHDCNTSTQSLAWTHAMLNLVRILGIYLCIFCYFFTCSVIWSKKQSRTSLTWRESCRWQTKRYASCRFRVIIQVYYAEN